MNQRGFISIPLILIVIITSIVVSAGTATVLQNQEVISTFVANISNFLVGNKDVIIEKDGVPQEIEQKSEGTENQGEEAQTVFEPTISGVEIPHQQVVVIQEEPKGVVSSNTTQNSNSSTTEPITESTSVPDTQPAHVTPPEISSISISNVKAYSATINWVTDEPSTSRVEYGTFIYVQQQKKFQHITPVNSDLVNYHSVVLSNLEPRQDYSFNIISTDAFGNQSESRSHITSELLTTKSNNPGSLYVSPDSDTPALAIRIPKSLTPDNIVGKIAFKAEGEDICIHKITIQKVSGSIIDFETVSLWDADIQLGSQAVTTDFPIIFNFLEDSCWVIPNGQTKHLAVRADFREITTQDSYGAVSGDNPKLCIQGSGITTRGVTSESSANMIGLGYDICGEVILRKSQPIFNVDPPTSTKLLSSSENTLYRWTITADPKNNISWKRIQFDLSGSLNGQSIGSVPESTINQIKIYDVTKNSEVMSTISGAPGLSGLVVTIEAENEQTILAGSTTTYELRGRMPSLNSDSFISTSINSKSKNIITANYDSINSGSFIWSDRSAASHSEASSDWTNDYGISGLPIDALLLSR